MGSSEVALADSSCRRTAGHTRDRNPHHDHHNHHSRRIHPGIADRRLAEVSYSSGQAALGTVDQAVRWGREDIVAAGAGVAQLGRCRAVVVGSRRRMA